MHDHQGCKVPRSMLGTSCVPKAVIPGKKDAWHHIMTPSQCAMFFFKGIEERWQYRQYSPQAEGWYGPQVAWRPGSPWHLRRWWLVHQQSPLVCRPVGRDCDANLDCCWFFPGQPRFVCVILGRWNRQFISNISIYKYITLLYTAVKHAFKLVLAEWFDNFSVCASKKQDVTDVQSILFRF